MRTLQCTSVRFLLANTFQRVMIRLQQLAAAAAYRLLGNQRDVLFVSFLHALIFRRDFSVDPVSNRHWYRVHEHTKTQVHASPHANNDGSP